MRSSSAAAVFILSAQTVIVSVAFVLVIVTTPGKPDPGVPNAPSVVR